MTLTSFDRDVCSVELPEVVTSLVLDHKTSGHFSTVELGQSVDNCRFHPIKLGKSKLASNPFANRISRYAERAYAQFQHQSTKTTNTLNPPVG